MNGQLTCNSCSNTIDDLDNFCSSCGKSLRFTSKKTDRQQLVAFISVTFMFVASIVWLGIHIVVDTSGNYDIYDATQWLSKLLRLAVLSIPLILSISMKASNLKWLAIIFASIYTLIEIYWFIKSLIPVETIDFQF